MTLDLGIIDDRDDLAAAVRMLAHGTALRRRLDIVRSGIVEQEEWLRTDARCSWIAVDMRAHRGGILRVQ
jgi:hypothetical protein